MSRTRTELRFKALSIVMGGDVGQVPSAEDATALDGYIDDVISELSADDIIDIDADDIPNELFGSLASMVANACADEFGGKTDPTKAAALSNRIRKLTAQRPGYGPMQAEYF